ncbi:hypothetical protein [Streptomyces sp. NPDC093261]|uniref:hypothetical protein n=1 Tax=Streptomyces sp. NPDC093261 TaxID=3366037 RepID=UPI00381B09A6
MAAWAGDRGGGPVNSVPQHLMSEDRQEYERLLDEALGMAPHRPELAAVGQRLNPEQLRTMALNATALITAAAATEYQHYVQVRQELRAPSCPYQSSGTAGSAGGSAPASAPSVFPRSDTRTRDSEHPAPKGLGRRLGVAVLGGQPSGRGTRYGVASQHWAGMTYGRRLLAALLGLHVRPEVPKTAAVAEASTQRTCEQSTAVHTRPARRETPPPETTGAAGAGVFAVFAVLAPLLSATAAVIFFLIGLFLKMSSPGSAFARTMINTGWLFGATAGGTVVVCAVGLLGAAVRHRGQSTWESADYHQLSGEVDRAREAWRQALLERGILPFLREALADPTAPSHWNPSSAPTGRRPSFGFDRPGFTSPGDGPASAHRPSFAGPDYASPDFAGPEHQPE